MKNSKLIILFHKHLMKLPRYYSSLVCVHNYIYVYEGRLFVCFVVMRSTKLGASDCVLDVVGQLLMRRMHGLGSMAFFELGIQKFFNIE
jgi:hypothetical protein